MKKKRIITIIIAAIILLIGIKGILMYRDYRAEQERLAQSPYFTKDKLSEYEMNILVNRFQVKATPNWRERWWNNEEEWPDYSYYTIEATEDTKIAVTVLNYWLFDDLSEYDKEGFEKAKEYGFTTDNRLSVDWVMEHPREAAEIMSAMANEGDIFRELKDWIYPTYEKITGEKIENN